MAKASKSTRVLISLPEKFLAEIDQLADDEQRRRSELIREALRVYIKSNEKVDIRSQLLD